MKRNVAMSLAALAFLVVGLIGCSFHATSSRPAQVVYVGAPVIVQEGAYVDGVIVAPPPVIVEWVIVDGGWYYYHPHFHRWVYAPRPRGWHPPRGSHEVTIRDWSERPRHADEWHDSTREAAPAPRSEPPRDMRREPQRASQAPASIEPSRDTRDESRYQPQGQVRPTAESRDAREESRPAPEARTHVTTSSRDENSRSETVTPTDARHDARTKVTKDEKPAKHEESKGEAKQDKAAQDDTRQGENKHGEESHPDKDKAKTEQPEQ